MWLINGIKQVMHMCLCDEVDKTVEHLCLYWRKLIARLRTSDVGRPSCDGTSMSGVIYRVVCVNTVKRTDSPLSPACFTFVREPVYHEPSEVVRMAGLPNVVGRHRHTKARSTEASASSSSSASDCRERSTESKLPVPSHSHHSDDMNTNVLMSKQKSVFYLHII